MAPVGDAFVPDPKITTSSVADGTIVALGDPPVKFADALYFTLHNKLVVVL